MHEWSVAAKMHRQMQRCAFCGLGPSRRAQFFTGLEDVAICDCCLEVAVELSTSAVRVGDPKATSNGSETVRCRFCGRMQSECGPGSHIGGSPDMFICSACKRLAARELGVS
jgi:hypothetical protein